MADKQATSFNPDSMNNKQGEFQPTKPRSEPMEKGGHQPGQLVGNDAAPEFSAKTLPPGTAPKESTFKPNPVNEIPGQANNPDVESAPDMSGASKALDMPGATSADVHTGLGHPGQGQTSSELKESGKSSNKGQGTGEGGTGMQGPESEEAKKLQQDHVPGPKTTREHNISLDGAESKEPVHAEEVSALGQQTRKGDYDRAAEKPPGSNS
ncbi:hypothetical protein LTS08_005472 [Lithohypha guttulata]|uniref:Uncharacterized protein n=1 Tax=Lithohypha guttulata TaxID=1690604 RepID=A0AAN7T2P0_9EURO|nr:hypothetical protein LTR51_003350 [Lithohypha guttulata]KAK5087174.1 hypothetical protein LTR05_004345 [Lithohypha guttulata]KAK5099757.1 hypothetical protein LTS08_005472 [Lithohypha guttulata]